MLKRLMVGLTAVACVAGCSSADVPGTVGELGEGVFRYECIEDGDARCNTTETVNSQDVRSELGVDPELPVAVAVGGRFDLTYLGDAVTDDGEYLILDTVPARTDLVRDSGGFIIEKPGVYSFLAKGQEYVADFVNLEALAVDSLEIYHEESQSTDIELIVGNDTHVAVVPSSEEGIALAGALPYTWTSSDAAILAVDSAGTTGTPTSGTEINDDEVRIVAIAEGSATLTVSQGDIEATFSITVTPEVAP